MSKAVFLDRDGTIARDVPYCSRPEDLEILPTVPQAIRLLNQHGFKVVVVTNQSGVARGYFSKETLRNIHDKMSDELARQDANIDAIYYCPHHPDDNCQCRKPKTGLLTQAAMEHNIELSTSFMVGDTEIDIVSGNTVNCKTILVTTGPKRGEDVVTRPDYIAESLLDASQWIIRYA